MWEVVAETILAGVLLLFSLYVWRSEGRHTKRDSVIKALADHVGFDLKTLDRRLPNDHDDERLA